MTDNEQLARLIGQAIRDIPKKYYANIEAIKLLEKETLDLMHYTELIDLNAREGYKLYKEMQRVRRERRKLKDENEELKHLVPEFTNMKNKADKFNKAAGEIKTARKTREERSYRCRVRRDLENIINGVKE